MSQQVYANERQKYYPCPGVNTMGLSVAQTIGAGNTQTIQYNAAILTQVPDQVSASLGNITFAQEGIYSIKLRLGFAPDPFNVSQDPDLTLAMRIATVGAANGLALCGLQQRYIARGGSTDGSDGFIEELVYTGYFAKGDAVFLEATNNSTVFATQFNTSHTIAIVCKLI